jgi:hypothetical protein
MSTEEYYTIQHTQPMYMYHGLFACTVYDSYSLELCTMYDSHDVLRVLYIIYMYKFSRCYVIIFHCFSFHLPIFSKKKYPKITTPIFKKTDRFINKTSVFRIFTILPLAPGLFDRIFVHRIFEH